MKTRTMHLTRHYLHGDPIEDRPGEYYCKKCDSFEPKDHFKECPLSSVLLYGSLRPMTHEYRYVMERRRWFGESEKSRSDRGSLYALDDHGNLFRTNTAKKQHLPKLKPQEQMQPQRVGPYFPRLTPTPPPPNLPADGPNWTDF